MKILYIGHYEEGSTSKMRGDYLREILIPEEFTIIDINIPLQSTHRIFRSFGWRTKKGPLIKNINNFILDKLHGNWNYDLIWVDKGVFVLPEIILKLKEHSRKLVHFTPDPAFTYHRSGLFFKALKYYDYCVTTKSFEVDMYKKNGVNELLTSTQGFRPDLHKPYHRFEEKKGVVFIGHHEPNREKALVKLLENKIPLTLAGIGWSSFYEKHKNATGFDYLGSGIFGEKYAQTISAGLIGIGFLSKIIPELHTTRTFEIPACGTALFTEKNEETAAIFNDREVYFYEGNDDLVNKIISAMADRAGIEKITENGYKCVTLGGYDYKHIIQKIIDRIYPILN